MLNVAAREIGGDLEKLAFSLSNPDDGHVVWVSPRVPHLQIQQDNASSPPERPGRSLFPPTSDKLAEQVHCYTLHCFSADYIVLHAFEMGRFRLLSSAYLKKRVSF